MQSFICVTFLAAAATSSYAELDNENGIKNNGSATFFAYSSILNAFFSQLNEKQTSISSAMVRFLYLIIQSLEIMSSFTIFFPIFPDK